MLVNFVANDLGSDREFNERFYLDGIIVECPPCQYIDDNCEILHIQ